LNKKIGKTWRRCEWVGLASANYSYKRIIVNKIQLPPPPQILENLVFLLENVFWMQWKDYTAYYVGEKMCKTLCDRRDIPWKVFASKIQTAKVHKQVSKPRLLYSQTSTISFTCHGLFKFFICACVTHLIIISLRLQAKGKWKSLAFQWHPFLILYLRHQTPKRNAKMFFHEQSSGTKDCLIYRSNFKTCF